MQDRPDAAELADALRRFLQEDVLPVLPSGRLSYQLRVAINAVGILEREARYGTDLVVREAEQLAVHLGEPMPVPVTHMAVLQLNKRLCDRLRSGDEPPGTLVLLQHLQRDKLLVASPMVLAKYSAPDSTGACHDRQSLDATFSAKHNASQT